MVKNSSYMTKKCSNIFWFYTKWLGCNFFSVVS